MKRTLSLVVCIFFASCGETPHYHQYPVDSYGADTAMIHIVIGKRSWGHYLTIVDVDGHQIGRIGSGGSLTTPVPAKKVTISMSSHSVILDAQKGKEYFYEISLPVNWLWTPPFKIWAISEQRARELGFSFN